MGLIDDYESYFLKYTKIYGEKIAVFYQVGKFHEIYGLDNDKEKMGNVAEVAQLLNIKETRENTSILENSRKNALQAGFNSVSLDRNVDLLVNYGYTVIVVNQIPNTNPVKRAVDYIASPTTNLNTRQQEDPYLVAIYIDQMPTRASGINLRYIGMVAMDTTTGNTWFYETNGHLHDQSLADDDLMRFIQTFAPVEIIVTNSSEVSADYVKDLTTSWGFNIAGLPMTGLKPIVYLNSCEGRDVLPTTIEYAEAYLTPIFPDRGHLNVLDYLNMTRYVAARQAYLYLLNFCEVHNRLFLKSLQLPHIWENSTNLILDNSSIMQLGIAESYYEKQETVLSMLSGYLNTAMGRRLLRERLLNPITDTTELIRRYTLIDNMQIKMTTILKGEHIPRYEITKRHLKGVRDFDRLHRKIALGTLGPAEFYALHNNYVQLMPIIDEQEIKTTFQKYIDTYSKILRLESCGSCTVLENLEENLFRKGYDVSIDTITANLDDTATELAMIMTYFPEAKYHEDEGGAYLSLTKTQFQRLKKDNKLTESASPMRWSDLYLDEKNKSNVKIRFDHLSALFNDKQTYLSELRILCIAKYKEFLKSIDLSCLQRFTIRVAELDLSAGMAHLSDICVYCKPRLENTENSFVHTQALRHPIVERHTRYVAHDISLGENAVCDGILLYGVNQTGKSCTMKSLGIAVTMAQAGLFVAAKSFRLRPYEILLTRILNNDNISRGLSTFAVEMLELRSILCRCNNRTLVLGDEVCHGTETASAVSLVGASIMHMARMHTNFIFATHLHELSTMSELQLPNVKQFHLSISFQGTDIIYDRQMKEGSGVKLYGLEVARFLRVAESVMNDAYKIRDKYYTLKTVIKQSSYNKNVYLTTCAICDKKAVDVHHINFQSESDEHGLIEHMHMNHADNLVQLCEEHHNLVHDNSLPDELIILGYQPSKKLEYYIRPRLKSLRIT